MSIFSKLIPLGKNKASGQSARIEQSVRELVSDLDNSSPIRYLKDIADRLAEIKTLEEKFGAEAAQTAYLQLDQSGHAVAGELLQKYLFSNARESSSQNEGSALDSHAAALITAHAGISAVLIPLAQSDAERNRVARDAVCFFRAWSLRNKLQNFQYQKASAALWRQAHNLLALLVQHKLEQVLVIPYTGESATTPLREYLNGAYFECLPGGNLFPQQQEILDRFLRACERLQFTSEVESNSTHCVDLLKATGPEARKDGDARGQAVHFLSTISLHEELVGLADRLAAEQGVPKWLSAISVSNALKEAAFRSVGKYWSTQPPQRGAARRGVSWELRVVIGFDGAFQMITASQDVRAYSKQLSEPSTSPSSSVEAAPSPDLLPINSPFDLLLQIEATGRTATTLSLEAVGARANLETWHIADVSATGFGAILPTLLARHSVGTLIAFRPTDGVNWRLGIIRRAGRDASNRPLVGVETIDDEAVCAHANLIDSESVGVWTEGEDAAVWSNIIFLKKGGDEVLIPHASFSRGKLVRATSAERNWYIRFDTLLDRGTDYDRVKFTASP
jgi:hypothetical protein